MVVNCSLTGINGATLVKILVLDITGSIFEGTDRQFALIRRGGDICIGIEITVRDEAPDFSDFFALIPALQGPGIGIPFRNPGLGISKREGAVNGEVLAEGMVVVKLEFPAVRAHVASVLERCGSNTDVTDDFISVDEHTDVLTDEPVEGGGQIIVQETGIETEVERTDLLPGHVRIDSGRRGDGGLLVAVRSLPVGGLGREGRNVRIPGIKGLVPDGTVGSTDLEHRDIRLDRGPERLF